MLRENALNRHPVAAFVRELFSPAVPAAASAAAAATALLSASPAASSAARDENPAPPAATEDIPAPRRVRRSIDYTPAQQRELESLCTQLFKRKALVTSGQL